MSGDLQATVKFSVELLTFHNVDLFQRGYYQIQCTLKPPLKMVTNVEVECRHEVGCRNQDYMLSADVSPSSPTAISKTFQIMFKNEDIVLDDCFVFTLNMLVDSDKIVEQIDQADIQLLVELYFSDSESGPDSDSLVSVVSQTMKLHMSCVKGFHHHVPLLFDYYHFAIIDVNIHGTLVGLNLPEPSMMKVEGKKNWLAKSSPNNRLAVPPFYVTLFSNKALSPQSSKTSIVEKQLNFAYDTHRSLCSTLMSAQVNLLAYFQCLSEFLPENQRIDLGVIDFGERLEEFSSAVEALSSCDETFAQICSDLNSISSEVELVWSQFLEFFSLNKSILPFLRKEHYQQRVAHLSEAFFVQENPWEALQIPTELSFQQHQSLSQSVKNSKYYQTIPPVLLECPALDGDNTSIPILFEDRFSTTFCIQEQEDHSHTEIEEISFTLDYEDGQDNMAETNGVDEGYLNVNLISDSVDSSPKECVEETRHSGTADLDIAATKQEVVSSSATPDNEGISQGYDSKETDGAIAGSRSDITERNPGNVNKEDATLEGVNISLDSEQNSHSHECEQETVKGNETVEQVENDLRISENLNENLSTVSQTKVDATLDIAGPEKESEGDGLGRESETVSHDTEKVLEPNNTGTDDADGTNTKAMDSEGLKKVCVDVVEKEQSTEPEHLVDKSPRIDIEAIEPDSSTDKPGGVNLEVTKSEDSNETHLKLDLEAAKAKSTSKLSREGATEFETSKELSHSCPEFKQSSLPCTELDHPSDETDGAEEAKDTATQVVPQQNQTKNEVQSSNEAVNLSVQDSSLSIATDSQSNSSEYDTRMSSENIQNTSECHVGLEASPSCRRNVNGVTVVDSAPNTSKKSKKKSSNKVVAASIYACFPMGCGGNASPSLGLCRMDSVYGGANNSRFEIAKRLLKRSLNYSYQIHSDLSWQKEREPYFSAKRPDSLETHLIVCVHGLDGNCGDLRLLRCYLEMALPSTRLDFLMSEVNQPDTFVNFEEMTENLVQEIIHYIEAYTIYPTKLSFIGHSLGNIIIRSALTHRGLEPFLDRMHTFLSLSGPHLGMVYQTSSLVSTGLWLMQKWKKSDSLSQLSLHDNPNLRQTFLYRLSQSKGLHHFSNILLVSSVQDHYVPYHSARMELCRAAVKDNSELGVIYREMVSNLLSPLQDKPDMNFIRYSVYHAIPSSANSLIGRAAHIAMLDSELFIEKLLLVSVLEYFR